MNTPPRTPRTPQLAPRLYNRRNEVSPPSVIRTRPRFARLRSQPYSSSPSRVRMDQDLGEVIETESEPEDEQDELRGPIFSLDDDMDEYYDDEVEEPLDTRSQEEIEESLKAKMKATEELPEEYEEAEEDDPNKCFYSYGYYDVNIQKFLDKHPDNFIIEHGDNVECESLSNLKQLYTNDDVYDIYYECSESNIKKTAEKGFTPISFTPDDYYTDVEYVKVSPTTNIFIVKPDWMYEGPVPEPRRFKLVNTGIKKRLIERSLTKSGANVVSGIHCDPLDTFDIYKLESVTLGSVTLGGKKKKHNGIKHKSIKHKGMKHKSIKYKKSKKIIKKSINKTRKNIKKSKTRTRTRKIQLKRKLKTHTRRVTKNKK